MRLLTWVWDIDIQVLRRAEGCLRAGNLVAFAAECRKKACHPDHCDVLGHQSGWRHLRRLADAHMDLAAGNAPPAGPAGRCATVAVDGMMVHTPAHVGDEVSVYADLISTGRTSIKFRVEAWRRSRDGDEQIKVTEAVFTFVAIDSGSRPRQLPRVEFVVHSTAEGL